MPRSLLWSLVVALGLAGCGEGERDDASGTDVVILPDAPDPGDPADSGDAAIHRDLPPLELPAADCGVTLENYFDRLIDALAGFYSRCSPGDRINFWQNPLHARWMLEGRVRPLQVEYEVRIAKGRLQLDEAVACTYLGLLKEGDCNATRTIPNGLVGTAGPGDACGVDEECPAGYFCRFSNATTCEGSCTARAGEGQPCDGGGCQPGLSCRLNEADEFRCVPSYWIREPGQPCDPATDVCARSFCDGSRCHDLPTPGASCSPGSYCQNGWCDRNLNLCVPYVGAGGQCQSWNSCEDGHYCTPFPEERCAPRLGLGQQCDPKRTSFDFPGVSLACASGLCDGIRKVCTDTPPASSCD